MHVGYTRAVAVTPHDTNNIAGLQRMKALYVGGNGNVTYIPLNGTTAVTLTGCLVGHVYYIAARVITTATTATNLVALGD